MNIFLKSSIEEQDDKEILLYYILGGKSCTQLVFASF